MTTKLNNALVQPVLNISRRILDIFMLLDCSWSMDGLKIAALNQAMRESSNELKAVAKQHPHAEFRIRCISFSDTIRWHSAGPDPVDIEKFSWKDLTVSGGTATGAAIQLLSDSIAVEKMPHRGLPPVMVLMSDGENTDGKDYDVAIAALNKEPWAAKAVRLSIGIGQRFDRQQLEKFTNRPDIGVLEATNAVDLANYIKYATITGTIAASQSATSSGSLEHNVAIPPPPTKADPNDIQLELF